MKRSIFISSPTQRDALADEIRNMEIGEWGVMIKIQDGQRSLKQNSAMHVYFNLLAKELNDAGLDMVATLKPGTEIPWTEHSVKTEIWGKVMQAMTGKTSTTKLERKEVSEIYEVVHRHMAQNHSVMVPFPSSERPMI